MKSTSDTFTLISLIILAMGALALIAYGLSQNASSTLALIGGLLLFGAGMKVLIAWIVSDWPFE